MTERVEFHTVHAADPSAVMVVDPYVFPLVVRPRRDVRQHALTTAALLHLSIRSAGLVDEPQHGLDTGRLQRLHRRGFGGVEREPMNVVTSTMTRFDINRSATPPVPE
ncbi:hypothetical protein [Nocardia brasiliensis]|uniref:hypothetical protein n=1 Tax=Nocardia brasiliensis TaxID=37326 RepID=UPI002458DE21|nr:hypothetical protein [Nocardia brasiliensis]